MPKTDREVFEYFRSDPETSVEVDNLAYASFAFHKYEWMEQFASLRGRQPTQAEENQWISELPDSRLDEIRDVAYLAFEAAADGYLRERIEQERKTAVEQSILTEIRQFTSFWRNFGPNLLIGIAASVAFSLLLIVMASIFADDPSPIALYKQIAPANSH